MIRQVAGDSLGAGIEGTASGCTCTSLIILFSLYYGLQ